MTTFATTGYGDLAPQSTTERMIASLLMLVGVAFFSLVIGEFIRIIGNTEQKLYVIDRGLSLHAWLTSLQSLTGSRPRPLPKKLLVAIDTHFKFFWKHERNLWMLVPENRRALAALPRNMSQKLFTNYLYTDVLLKFRKFFHTEALENS